MISDRDENGEFNFEEFLRIVTALKVSKDLGNEYEDNPSIKNHLAYYVASDRDYDGRVSIDELCEAYGRIRDGLDKADLG